MNTTLIQPKELDTPNLSIQERQFLLMALNTSLTCQATITVAFTYDKQTKGPARVAGRDYISLPGTSPKTQLGAIHRVWRAKEGVRFTVRSLTRGDGTNPTGYITVIPEGLRSFVISGFSIPKHGMTAV
ncbi:MAG: hypothetical protein MN733_30235 [Nitrososphaera sp.]|nr:hypothetical protein [Nitrososphaera sp.]